MMVNKKQGFALLYALLVSSIVLSIGIVLSTIVTKQLILSSVATNSQLAFYAADAGLECAKYYNEDTQFGYAAPIVGSDPIEFEYKYANPDGSVGIIECGSVDITLIKGLLVDSPYTSPIMSFDIFLGDATNSCAKVEVAFNPDFIVRSKGYSFSGDSGCGTSNSPRLVEREIVSGVFLD